MHLTDILTSERIAIDVSGERFPNKEAVLLELSRLLAPPLSLDPVEAHRLLSAREELQSTGIGDGIAIPHASTEAAARQAAALLLVPKGLDFSAIDRCPVSIVFGVLGPTRSPGEHLRTLARISRLLREPSTRSSLLDCRSPEAAFSLIAEQDTNP